MSDKKAYTYTGAGGFVIGLPARDLTEADLQASADRTGRKLAEIRKIVERSNLYQPAKAGSKGNGDK